MNLRKDLKIISEFIEEKEKVLDVGCAKGFMLYDLTKLIPGIEVKGIDISSYAIENSKEEIRENIVLGNSNYLPWNITSSIFASRHSFEYKFLWMKIYQRIRHVKTRIDVTFHIKEN